MFLWPLDFYRFSYASEKFIFIIASHNTLHMNFTVQNIKILLQSKSNWKESSKYKKARRSVEKKGREGNGITKLIKYTLVLTKPLVCCTIIRILSRKADLVKRWRQYESVLAWIFIIPLTIISYIKNVTLHTHRTIVKR